MAEIFHFRVKESASFSTIGAVKGSTLKRHD